MVKRKKERKKKKFHRTLFFAKLSVPLNFLMAAGKIVMAVFTLSFFLAVSAFYSLSIGFAKFVSIKGHKNIKNNYENFTEFEKRQHQYNSYLLMGFAVLAASAIYMIYSVRMFVSNVNTQYTMIQAVSIACFTFTDLALSIRGIYNTKNANEPLMEAIKFTSLASSMILLALTQTSIMSFAAEGDNSLYNGISGTVFGSFAAITGLYMIAHSKGILNGKDNRKITKRIYKIIKKIIPSTHIETLTYIDGGEKGKKIFIKFSEPQQDVYFNEIKTEVKRRFDIETLRA